MRFVKDDGGRAAAGFKGTAGDCVCRSIAIATGKPYQEIYSVLAQNNHAQRISKRNNKGQRRPKSAENGINTTRKWFKDYMRSLGFVWMPCMKIGTGCQVHLVPWELPEGRLVVSLSRHFTAVIDGVIHDIYNPDRGGSRCVYGYWKLPLIFTVRQKDEYHYRKECVSLR